MRFEIHGGRKSCYAVDDRRLFSHASGEYPRQGRHPSVASRSKRAADPQKQRATPGCTRVNTNLLIETGGPALVSRVLDHASITATQSTFIPIPRGGGDRVNRRNDRKRQIHLAV
jgi:hypothetical protein